MRQKIYNISADKSFVDVLAQKFLAEYAQNPSALADVLFLLPNRRACQSLTDAFVRQNGLVPTILPQIKPIYDVEEDEVLLCGARNLGELSPAIDATERVLILTRLIMQRPVCFGNERISLAQAYNLAQNLAALLDTVEQENLDFARLPELVSAEYAAHWQETLRLLAIITENWPLILQEQGKVDVVKRRHSLLKAEMAFWRQSNTEQRIVVAGTTAAFPLLKALVKTVLDLPNGEVYLYGLDTYLSDDDWAKVDENHPQFELKELLKALEISRYAVQSEGGVSAREQMVAEVMRPAQTSGEWQHLTYHPLDAAAFEKLRLLNCDDMRQEAQAIALIIRHTLEEPEKTASLVTSDRTLARRVASELKKWHINADDSAGQPLGLTPIGIYLRLIINVLENDFSQVSLLALAKHPFCACGLMKAEFNLQMRHIELAWRKKWSLTPAQEELLQNMRARLQPLSDLFLQPRVDLKTMFTAHIQAAERLADTDVKKGESIIWRKDAGQAAARFVSTFAEHCAVLSSVATADYGGFMAQMLMEQNVRARYGMHPRVKILGPIEARLQHFDVAIIGEVNEGMWPKLPSADMWMSRQMKRDFEMSSPERAIGVMAADFAHLLNGKEVYLTRAERLDGAPTKKSRWWLRLETVLAANFGTDKEKIGALYDNCYTAWAKYLERAEVLTPIKAPAPKPPVSMRPREISASKVETYMNDPYAIFARYILRLKPLEELDQPADARIYGNLVHKVLEEFNQKYADNRLPENVEAELLAMMSEQLADAGIAPEQQIFWQARFAKTAEWVAAIEQNYRPNLSRVYPEVVGKRKYCGPAGDFLVTARADRIEAWQDGTLSVVDYKTGSLPKNTDKLVKTGYKPQLSVEGLIAAAGGFEGIEAQPVKYLRYWQTDGREIVLNESESAEAMRRVDENIKQLITVYDMPQTPYLTKPNPAYAPEKSDYDHLSRYLEWAVKEDSEDGQDDA